MPDKSQFDRTREALPYLILCRRLGSRNPERIGASRQLLLPDDIQDERAATRGGTLPGDEHIERRILTRTNMIDERNLGAKEIGVAAFVLTVDEDAKRRVVGGCLLRHQVGRIAHRGEGTEAAHHKNSNQLRPGVGRSRVTRGKKLSPGYLACH